MRHFKISALLIVGLFVFSGAVHPWGATGGDGTRAAAIQETAVFYNNSEFTMTEGMIVVKDNSGGTAGTTLGAYVTITTSADASTIVGVVKSSSAAADTPVVVITKGPADTLVLDSSDPITISQYVGTGTTRGYGGACAGNAGAGYLGQAMEVGDGTDTGRVWVWVDPGINF